MVRAPGLCARLLHRLWREDAARRARGARAAGLEGGRGAGGHRRRRAPQVRGEYRSRRGDAADGRHRTALSTSSLVALRHRNFRLLWIGQLVSMAGSMMQSAAILWQVSLLVPPSHRGLALGMVGAVRLVPIVVFSMVSGVAA